jgi:hypothetical protein
MRISLSARAILAALIVSVGAANAARADVKDYEFQLVAPTVTVGPTTDITVRLVYKATGKAVPDAVIFATRLDMAPDGMEAMTTKVAAMPGAEPGLYRFEANVSMAGQWRLSLGAKIQGETGTVESKLVIQAQK